MSGPTVLALPVFSKSFVIECNASGRGLGVVVMKEGKPTAYLSQALKGKSLSLSTYEKELLALVLSIQKWQPYLLVHGFIVRTNQQSLKFFLEQRVGTPTQQRWLSNLLEYDFKVEYRNGKENMAADALSRRTDEGAIMGISSPITKWVTTVRIEYDKAAELQKLQWQYEGGELDLSLYTSHDGMIFYKGRLVIGLASPLWGSILKQLLEGPIGGHLGFHKTLHRVQADLYWRGLRSYVQIFVCECDVCQRVKAENVSPAGLL